MKKRNTIILLVFIITLLSMSLSAQITRKQLTIGELTVPIDNVILHDSLNEKNHLTYTVAFDIQVKSGDPVTALMQLQSSLLNKTQPKIAIVTLGLDMVPSEERVFDKGIVEEIVFPSFKADGREVVVVSVKIKSNSVTINQNSIPKTATVNLVKTFSSTVSNFKMEIDKLPSNRVNSIGSLVLRNSGDKTPYLFIELASADAPLWQEWLAKSNNLTKQGFIYLFASNLKDVIMRLKLTDAQIVSSSSSYKSTSTTIAKTTFGLRVKSVEITGAK